MDDLKSVYSVILVLDPIVNMAIPVSTQTKSHAAFLNLVGQFDPTLSARLHDEPDYRPFMVSPLYGGKILGERMTLRRGQLCRLRVTLLDGGTIWNALQTYFHETETIYIHIGDADFRLIRLLINPGTGPMHLAGYACWQTLANIPIQTFIAMNFSTATTFSLGGRQFCIFPEPTLIWGSLLRVWNRYAPEHLYFERYEIRTTLEKHVSVMACRLHHAYLHFPTYVQKGFLGWCSYRIDADQLLAQQLTSLAAFAQYAGVGYKTTMGMGQVYVKFGKTTSNHPSLRVKHNYFL
jgi:CRISPR-associated endoribonuclease Cas6